MVNTDSILILQHNFSTLEETVLLLNKVLFKTFCETVKTVQ